MFAYLGSLTCYFENDTIYLAYDKEEHICYLFNYFELSSFLEKNTINGIILDIKEDEMTLRKSYSGNDIKIENTNVIFNIPVKFIGHTQYIDLIYKSKKTGQSYKIYFSETDKLKYQTDNELKDLLRTTDLVFSYFCLYLDRNEYGMSREILSVEPVFENIKSDFEDLEYILGRKLLYLNDFLRQNFRLKDMFLHTLPFHKFVYCVEFMRHLNCNYISFFETDLSYLKRLEKPFGYDVKANIIDFTYCFNDLDETIYKYSCDLFLNDEHSCVVMVKQESKLFKEQLQVVNCLIDLGVMIKEEAISYASKLVLLGNKKRYIVSV